jgi:predicted nucleotidyltransferase
MSQIALPEVKVGEFCRKWKITELALFGSVLRQDFRPDSDVDVMVSFDPAAC